MFDAFRPYKRGTNLHEARERRVRALLLLELILAIQLVRAVRHERVEVRHSLEQDVADLLDDSVRLLPLVEGVPQARVDGDDVEDVPEDLLEELRPSLDGDDVRVLQALDPELQGVFSREGDERSMARTSRKYSMSRTKSRSV